MAFAVIISSCSIKEDRMACPCALTFVDADGTAALSDSYRVTVFGEIREEFISAAERMLDGTHGIAVRKGMPFIVVSAGSGIEGDVVSAVAGRQIDSLYACGAVVDCTDETAEVKVARNKQFATVDLTFIPDDGVLEFPFSLVLKAPCNGFDLRSLEPLRGSYSAPFASSQDNRKHAVRIPRQKDSNDIVIELRRGAVVEDTIRLGDILAGMDYNWNTDSLGDITLSFGYRLSSFTVEITPWEGSNSNIMWD